MNRELTRYAIGRIKVAEAISAELLRDLRVGLATETDPDSERALNLARIALEGAASQLTLARKNYTTHYEENQS